MPYLDLILSFVVGLAILGLLALVFSFKVKGITRLLINVLAGAIALILLSIFKISSFTLSPLSVFIVALLGVPGLIVIYIIITFL